MINQEANQKRFKELMSKVTREGVDDLMDYISKTDFASAPASTHYHLCCEGGLLQHSLNVYDCMQLKRNNPLWAPFFEKVPEESIIIMSLLHDLCKVNTYVKGTKNVKTYDPEEIKAAKGIKINRDGLGDFIWKTVQAYEWHDCMPLGHGDKSVMLIQQFMKLKAHEVFAIRWHMGFSENSKENRMIGEAMEKYPIALALFEADMEASKLLEDTQDNKS